MASWVSHGLLRSSADLCLNNTREESLPEWLHSRGMRHRLSLLGRGIKQLTHTSHSRCCQAWMKMSVTQMWATADSALWRREIWHTSENPDTQEPMDTDCGPVDSEDSPTRPPLLMSPGSVWGLDITGQRRWKVPCAESETEKLPWRLRWRMKLGVNLIPRTESTSGPQSWLIRTSWCLWTTVWVCAGGGGDRDYVASVAHCG